jgi:hypothetical protein
MHTKFEELLKRTKNVLSAAGFDLWNNQFPTAHELILEADLKDVGDRVGFRVVSWRGMKEFITETKLRRQDVFVCNEWGLFLLDTGSESDIEFEEHTFPDPEYFNKEAVEEGGIFYNADLSLIVNNLIVLPEVRTDRFKNYLTVAVRRERGISGLVEIDQLLVLEGCKTIYFNLDLPRKTEWKDSPIRLRLRLKGILCRNAAIIT